MREGAEKEVNGDHGKDEVKRMRGRHLKGVREVKVGMGGGEVQEKR